MVEKKSVYCDDRIQLGRYERLVASLCAKELSRIRNLSWVDEISEPRFIEEPSGLHVYLHEVFADDASDALYEVSYEFFVTYYGRFQLQQFAVDPVPSSVISDPELPFPWEGGES